MKWSKQNIENLSNNKVVIKLCKVFNIVLCVIAFLFILAVLGMLSDTSSKIQNNVYSFANSALEIKNSIAFLFLCIFVLSLFLNKKLMIIIWIATFFQLNQLFLKVPELKKVAEIERCLDVNCYDTENQTLQGH